MGDVQTNRQERHKKVEERKKLSGGGAEIVLCSVAAVCSRYVLCESSARYFRNRSWDLRNKMGFNARIAHHFKSFLPWSHSAKIIGVSALLYQRWHWRYLMLPPEIMKHGLRNSLPQHLIIPIIQMAKHACILRRQSMTAQNSPYCLWGVVKTSQKPASVLPEAVPIVCSICASVINCSWFNICSRLEFHLYSARLCFPFSVCIYIQKSCLHILGCFFFFPRMTDTVTMTVD